MAKPLTRQSSFNPKPQAQAGIGVAASIRLRLRLRVKQLKTTLLPTSTIRRRC